MSSVEKILLLSVNPFRARTLSSVLVSRNLHWEVAYQLEKSDLSVPKSSYRPLYNFPVPSRACVL